MLGRIFGGISSVDPTNLNKEMSAQSLNKIDQVLMVGAEVLHSPVKYFEWGVRYTKNYASQDEASGGSSTSYHGTLNQDSLMFITRIPYIKTNLLRADVFGAYGGTNTTFTFETASMSGDLTKRDKNSWYAGACSAFGASVAVGYKSFYFYVEAGSTTNIVKNPTRSGTVNSNVTEIDISGPYVSAGILIDGIGVTNGK
jgi:hypothetical protein